MQVSPSSELSTDYVNVLVENGTDPNLGYSDLLHLQKYPDFLKLLFTKGYDLTRRVFGFILHVASLGLLVLDTLSSVTCLISMTGHL
jgi:hypothetical protein